MLEIENIYELRLSKKIEEHDLLIFDVGDNVSARLHKRNLSNNSILSQKMFDLFDVGHEVTVLTTDFNEEKKYFELSTKVFRNSLDNVLSFTKCNQIIKDKFSFYGDIHPDHLTQYRNILDRLRGDLASTGLTFLYELLQNAVDHPNNNFNNEVSVHFEVFNNYLLLKHNGSLFTENNFNSICGILFGEQTKETDANRIGYKGIGFKSVFRHTNNVYVRSGNFSFSFNRQTGENKPWEVMPVFQNEIDKIDEIPQFDFFNSPVAFAFEFTSEAHKNDVIGYLTELSQNPYLLIFLDKLRRLKITIPNEEHDFEKEIITDNNGNNTIQLKINDIICSEWVSFTNTYSIKDQDIIDELLDENNKSIPNHFRQFRSPKIDIIVPNEQIENPINLFAYLPLSSTKLQLDYIVNADFIPNLDRSNIIENLSYNFKLADFSGAQLIKACETFALNKDFKKITRLFPNFETGVNQFKDKVRESFLKNIEKSKIFPTHLGEVDSITEVFFDETKLYEIIPEQSFLELLGTKRKPLDIGSGLVSEYLFLHKELELGYIFGKENLISSLKTEKFAEWLKIPENNFRIITHFQSNDELKDILKKEDVIIDSNKRLSNLTSLYKGIPKELSFLGVSVINSELLAKLEEKNVSLKLLEFDPITFYTTNIVGKEQTVNSLLISGINLLDFWRFVYNNWGRLKEEKDVVNSLKNIFILCKSVESEDLSYQAISSTYLSTEFDNESNIESIINDIGITKVSFISEKIISKIEEIEKWRKIFKKLGVITDLKGVISNLIEKLPSIDDETKHLEVGKQIFKYWKENRDKETQLSSEQIETVSKNLKIKCIDNSFRASNKCFISDHYTTTSIINEVISEIDLPNQITDEYEKRPNYVVDWNNYFRLIGCQLLSEKKEVFEIKVDYLIEHQDNFRENHFEILKTLSKLFKEKKDNNLSFDSLYNLKLKTNKGDWLLPNQVHFSSNYKPKLDLQKNEEFCNEFVFLNDGYASNDVNKFLLSKIGVNDSFKLEIIEKLKFDDFDCLPIKELLFGGHGFKTTKDYLLSRGYTLSQIQNYTTFEHHINCYPILSESIVQKYNQQFFDQVLEGRDEYFIPTKIVNNRRVYDSCDNQMLHFIKHNKTVENCNGVYVSPVLLYSFKHSNYINDKSLLPKFDYSNNFKLEKSIEELIGIRQELSEEHCIQLLKRRDNRISYEEVQELNIVEILKEYIPTNEQKKELFLLNKNQEWKPIDELCYSIDDEFEIDPDRILHQDFYSITDNFGVPRLSKDGFELKTEPINPRIIDEIKETFCEKARYLAFKIDDTNYQQIEQELIENINQYSFYEVESIEKVFPNESTPVFTTQIEFFYDTEENKIYYTGYWKSNREVTNFLYDIIQKEKVTKIWFDNVMNRWDDEDIIHRLEDDFGKTPWEIYKTNAKEIDEELEEELEEDNPDNPFSNITEDDKTFIKGIIKGEYDLDNKVDINTTAKIKALLAIKHEYDIEQIEDIGYHLKAEADEIIVRSAQNGLLFFDIHHWNKLNENNVRLAVYTNNKINLFDSQKDLIEFTQPQNRFGILRMPKDYSLEHYNTLADIEEKGKWHFVFIVNEHTKTAISYKSVFEKEDLYDEYNF
ncbi:MAG: hypothetical protein LC107_06540 [Chitinophagales bacterium]|nr:hypothetical protein [Chitinophagales bacterium]